MGSASRPNLPCLCHMPPWLHCSSLWVAAGWALPTATSNWRTLCWTGGDQMRCSRYVTLGTASTRTPPCLEALWAHPGTQVRRLGCMLARELGMQVRGLRLHACQSAMGTPGGTGGWLQDKLAWILLRTRSTSLVHRQLVQAACVERPIHLCATRALSRPQRVCRRSGDWRRLRDGTRKRLISGQTPTKVVGQGQAVCGTMLGSTLLAQACLQKLLKLALHSRPAAYALGAISFNTSSMCTWCYYTLSRQLPSAARAAHTCSRHAVAVSFDLRHLRDSCVRVRPAAAPNVQPLAAQHQALPAAAPEVLFTHTRTYDAKRADVWSTGVMLYAMLFCRYPFEESSSRWAPGCIC